MSNSSTGGVGLCESPTPGNWEEDHGITISRPWKRGHKQRAVTTTRTSRLSVRDQDQASVLDMEMFGKLVFPVVIISVLVACSPTEAWYKQVAGPSYYSVGRASGLLSGIRRSPYVRRAEPDPSDSGESASNNVFSDLTAQNFILKSMVSAHLFYQRITVWMGLPLRITHERKSALSAFKSCIPHDFKKILYFNLKINVALLYSISSRSYNVLTIVCCILNVWLHFTLIFFIALQHHLNTISSKESGFVTIRVLNSYFYTVT